MQLRLPIYPKEGRLLNSEVGVYEHDGLIQYLVNGLPVYSHSKEDLNSLSANRFNYAASQLANLLNDTETIFPGTNLKLIYKTSAFSNCEK